MLENNIIKRLSLIKYLYSFGIEQSHKTEPLGSFSILILHDAVELFNQLALEYKGDVTCVKDKLKSMGKKEERLYFMDYWGLMNLTQKESMKRFNKARVALKHHGILPSRLDIESFRWSVAIFFEENSQVIFNIDFNEISLIDLVLNEQTKENLNAAKKYLLENNIEESLVKSSIAFCFLMREYSQPRKFKESLNIPSTRDLGMENLKDNKKLINYISKLKRAIESTNDTLKCITLGIDYHKYMRFRSLTPRISWTLSGDYQYYSGWWHPGNFPSIDDAEFCINFVIQSAVILQQSKGMSLI